MRTVTSTIWLVLLAVLAGIGPLDEQRLEQVRTAADYEPTVDAPAFYPLLDDALTWSPDDEKGAAIPDYNVIAQNPDAYRGQLFLIEGQLVRRMPFGRMARQGPWDRRLEQWVVRYDPNSEETVLAYLVDPPDGAQAGSRVRLPGRFYMVMRTKVAGSEESSDFLVFVGRTAHVTAGSTPTSGGTGAGAILVALMLIMAIVYFAMRTKLKPKPIERRRLHHTDKDDDGDGRDDGEESTLPLPKDPADALDVLNQHRENE